MKKLACLTALFVVVTLFCVVLGGRVEYLRRWATYHECETDRYARAIELSRSAIEVKLETRIG